jgi:hypothetical protein
MAGASACKVCLAGFFASSAGKTMCDSCSPGYYTAPSGASTCSLCPPGYYCEDGSSKAGCPTHSSSSASTYHVTGCVCNAGYSGKSGGNCSLCPSGSFCPGVSNCSRPALTWLYRSEETGLYFLNLPQPVLGMKHYDSVLETDVYQKVRISSTLSADLQAIQLYTAAMNFSTASFTCDTVDISCKLLDSISYHADTSYVDLADYSKVACDFAAVCACGGSGSVATSDIDLSGTPFKIMDGENAWWTCCSYAYTFRSFCVSEQKCSVQVDGYCGSAYFNGRLSILDRSQYLQDVKLACSLYPRDPNLQCSGDKIPYNCDEAPLLPCPAGYVSTAGA